MIVMRKNAILLLGFLCFFQKSAFAQILPIVICPGDFSVSASSTTCNAQIFFAGEHAILAFFADEVKLDWTDAEGNSGGTTSLSLLLPAGLYTVTATASNSFGSTSCSFK